MKVTASSWSRLISKKVTSYPGETLAAHVVYATANEE